MLAGFDASPEEEAELIEYAKVPRTFADIPVADMTTEDKELLLSNAALLALSDGKQTLDEARALSHLVGVLKLGDAESRRIISEAKDGALSLPSRSLG